MKNLLLMCCLSMFILGNTQSKPLDSTYIYAHVISSSYDSRWVVSDSLFITKQTKDSLYFTINDEKHIFNYFLIDNKYYEYTTFDTFLIFDENVKIKDTFKLKSKVFDRQYVVDSIVSRKIFNGQSNQYFYLHNILNEGVDRYIIWIEGLGYMECGFNIRYIFNANAPSIFAFCNKGNLIYWEKEELNPTCHLDSMDKYLTGIDKVQMDDGVEVYPNPSQGKVHVEVDNSERNIIVVLDVLGKQIFKKNFVQSTTLNVKDYSKGIYLVSIYNKRGLLSSKRLIVQ